jgi:hypothetical protein
MGCFSLVYVGGRLQGFLERRRQRSSPVGSRPGESVAPFLLSGPPPGCGAQRHGQGGAGLDVNVLSRSHDVYTRTLDLHTAVLSDFAGQVIPYESTPQVEDRRNERSTRSHCR